MNTFRCFEYIKLDMDSGDLKDLNILAANGWHVVSVIPEDTKYVALLERELTDTHHISITRAYYQGKK